MSDVTFRGGDVGFCKSNNLELFGEVCADYLPTLMRWWKPAVYRPENEIHRLQDGRSNPLGLGLCELNFYLPCSRHSVFFHILTLIWQIWKSVTVFGGEIGFNLASPDGTGIIGSVSFTDSTFEKVSTAIIIGAPREKVNSDTTGLVIDNCVFKDVDTAVQTLDLEGDTDTLLKAGGAVKHWSIGPIYKGGNRTWASGVDSTPYNRHESLLGPEAGGLPSRPFFERKRNQYADATVDSFVHIKDFGAAGMSTGASRELNL